MTRALTTRPNAFTLVEVMVVIAVIGVLLTVLIPTLSRTNQSSMAVVDLSNQKQIVKGDISYSIDNKGRMVSPRTMDENGDHIEDDVEPRLWVRDYNYQDNDNIDPATNLATIASLEEGAIYSYIGNIDVYKSPFDNTMRVRSYSLNAFLGVNHGADDYIPYSNGQWGVPNIGVNYVPCKTLASVPQPGRTLCSIGEEDADSYQNGSVLDNRHGWLVHPGLPDSFTPVWIDEPPLSWDPGNVHLSYMDGSTYTYKVSDYANLVEQLEQHNQTVSSVDYEYFRMIMLPGRLQQ